MELNAIYTQIWDRLRAAALDSADAARVIALATQHTDGAQVRMVVLRDCDVETAALRIYSDRRARKIAQIASDPRVSALLYESTLQLRLHGLATVHLDGEYVEQCWAQCSPSARRAYLASAAPGSPLDFAGSGLPAGMDTQAPSRSQSETGRQNFAVIELAVERIDYLNLDPQGHRRAQFAIGPARQVESHWCIP